MQQGLPGVSEPCRHRHTKHLLALLDLSALRSLLAMVLCGVFSIDEWVDMMRAQPFHAK